VLGIDPYGLLDFCLAALARTTTQLESLDVDATADVYARVRL
jgi:hypothetical protein